MCQPQPSKCSLVDNVEGKLETRQEIQQQTLWPEQEVYERLRPLVLFGETAASRAKETGVSERTLRYQADQFEQYGMTSLFPKEHAPATETGRNLPPEMRQLIVNLKTINTDEWLLYWRAPDPAPARRKCRVEGIVQPLLFDVALMEKAVGADAPSLATPARSQLRVIPRPTADQEPEV